MNFIDPLNQVEVFKVAVRNHANRAQGYSYPLGDRWGPWIPFTAKKEDIHLALLLMRFSRSGTQVGVFACEDHHKFLSGTAAWLGAVFALSSAYFRTGSFSLEFLSLSIDAQGRLREARGSIPEELFKLGAFLNCPISTQSGTVRSKLTDAEGRLLYTGLGNLGAPTRAGLGNDQAVLLQAALLYRRNVWTKQSLEYIARFSIAKRSVLFGTDDILFLESPTSITDCDLLEIALAGEYACGWLAWQMRDAKVPLSSTWENDRTLVVTPRHPLTIVDDRGRRIAIASNQSLRFLLVPGSLGYYELLFHTILEKVNIGSPVILVVTQNMRQAPQAMECLNRALASGRIAGVFHLPEVVEELSAEVTKRLKLTGCTAHEPPEASGD